MRTSAYTKIALLFIFLMIVTRVSGQAGFSFGLGGEVNVITFGENGFASGGGLSADYRFGPVFAAGVRADLFYHRMEILGLENRIFARWYFAWPEITEFFFQGEAGILLMFQDTDMREIRASPAAGFSLGSRILLGRWYLEPYIRAGYPYIGGMGLTLGFTPSRKKAGKKRLEPPGREDLDSGNVIFRSLDSVPTIAALKIEPCVYFGPNTADFTGLDEKTIEDNYRVLQEVAVFLRENPGYSLVLEGHANPVSDTVEEERESLNPLSMARAEMAAKNLLYYGIDQERLIIAGSGGNKTLVPWKDRTNWNVNRRVEFMLIQKSGRIRNE
jgi:outer membrane protein OmpA-like peptidoglycan-associated protein